MKPTEMDPLLRPYAKAATEEEAQRLLGKIMTVEAEPLIKSIVSRRLGFSHRLPQGEGADVQGEIVLQLLHRLYHLRANPTEAPITNFRAYIAVASYRGCAAYLRQRYPQRWRLTTRLQYLLESQPQFGLWQNENEEWFAGFAGWVNDLLTRRWLGADGIALLLDGALPPELQGIPDATFRQVSAVDQLGRLLTWADGFIAFDDLVAILAQWWNIKDHLSPLGIVDKLEGHLDLEMQIGQRRYLQKLWTEIQALPLRQRQALLLNLRSGYTQSALSLFPALQIASVRQIAIAMDMPVEELASLWHELPLDDASIASQINVTRRQVINLRGAARERLLRRTQNW